MHSLFSTFFIFSSSLCKYADCELLFGVLRLGWISRMHIQGLLTDAVYDGVPSNGSIDGC